MKQLFKRSRLSTKLNADHQPCVIGHYTVDNTILLFLLPPKAYWSLPKATRCLLIFSQAANCRVVIANVVPWWLLMYFCHPFASSPNPFFPRVARARQLAGEILPAAGLAIEFCTSARPSPAASPGNTLASLLGKKEVNLGALLMSPSYFQPFYPHWRQGNTCWWWAAPPLPTTGMAALFFPKEKSQAWHPATSLDLHRRMLGLEFPQHVLIFPSLHS